MSGGQPAKGGASLYWYTEQLSLPYTAADFVLSGDKSWYKSDYHWRGNVVREIIREGEKKVASELVPYRVHLRFNENEEAVYQQYRLGGKVFPMAPEEIQAVQSKVVLIQKITKEQSLSGSMLIQGYWDGEVFIDCSGREYRNFKFNQTLSDIVINRLATLESYVAFTGFGTGTNLVVKEVLLLEDEDYNCIERPAFIKAK